jgi:hypothetical protein
VSPEEEALRAVVARLDGLGIAYMVTGSLASTHHGRPRTTQDVDVVIDPDAEALSRLVAGLHDDGFYVDDGVAAEALSRRGQFNAIQPESGVKIDLIVRKQRAFSIEELSRRKSVELAGGTRVSIASAEDSVLSKLEWARRAGGSEKQLADVVGVLEVQGEALDRDYVERWADALGLTDLWRRVSPPA